ncbi:MAG: cytochrome b N-terminal domain-containing protein [Acidobacteriota bacterium]
MGATVPTMLNQFLDNLRALPGNFRRAVFRRGIPATDKERLASVFANIFLHMHAPRTKKNTLRPTYTWGLGLISFYLFLVLLLSGVVLMFFYLPSVDWAYLSMKDLESRVYLGRLLRNLHRWAAHAMVATVFLHMLRVFYTGAYKRPREFNWMVGVSLLCLTLLLSFSGYLLPWDQLAYWAITVGVNIAGSAHPTWLPQPGGFDIGELTKYILLGGTEVGQEALIRFYVVHVIFLPLGAGVLIGVHFWRIRKDRGISAPDPEEDGAEAEEKEDGSSRPKRKRKASDEVVLTWPNTLLAELALLMGTLFLLNLLSLLIDAPLQQIADPRQPETVAKAPWYFLGIQELVSYSAFTGGVMIPLVVVIGLAAIPFVDRETVRVGHWFHNRGGLSWSLLSAAAGLVFTWVVLAWGIRTGGLRAMYPNVPQIVVDIVNPAALIFYFATGWHFVGLYRFREHRAATLGTFSVFVVAVVLVTVVGVYCRGPSWGFYWPWESWPAH